MLIPKELSERESFLQELIQQCEMSQMPRLAANTALRNYVLFGADNNISVNYNKIFPTVDLLSSFLYAQESVNFSVGFGVGTPKEQWQYGKTLRQKIHETWHDSGTDRRFGDAVFWSLVYNSFIIKTIYNGGVRTYGVYPHMIGVYREDIPEIDDQEAISHLYYTTASGLRTLTRFMGKEKQEKILARVSTVGPAPEGQMPQTVSQIIITASQPTIKGAVQPAWEQRYNYQPQIAPDLVEMRELWAYDDDLEDYRVFTIAHPNVVIFDRPGEQLCLKGEHPFTKVTPIQLPDYFWGMSMVQGLCSLQDWHDGHLKRVDAVFRRKMRPSRIFTGPGWAGLTDEKMLMLDREGGFTSSATPGAKVDTYSPEVNITEALAYLHELDQYFNEYAALGGNIMRAEGDEGVRSMQHAQVLQRMGSSRMKKIALRVEAPAERLATMILKLERAHDKEKYLDENQQEFLLSQVTENFHVKVSGHSLSPVFVEDTKQEAKALVGMKAMTRGDYIEETSPPMKEELLRNLEKIEEGEAKQAQVQTGIALMKAAKSLK